MTCILFHQGNVFTDSKHMHDHGPYQSLNKVKKLPTPITINYDPQSVVVVEGTNVPQEPMSDRIHGYTLAGNEDTGAACVRTIIDTDINHTLTRYAMMCDLAGMVNHDNGFNLILIGEKGEYVISVHPGERDKFFRFIARDMSHAYGTGGQTVIDHLHVYDEVIVAIFATMLIDNGSKGIVDSWELPTEANPVLRRIGIYEERSKPEMRELVAKNAEVLPDMVSRKTVNTMMQRAFRAGVYLGQNPRAASRAVLKMDDESFFLATVAMFGKTDPDTVKRQTEIMNDWKRQGLIPPRWTRPAKKATTRRKARDK